LHPPHFDKRANGEAIPRLLNPLDAAGEISVRKFGGVSGLCEKEVTAVVWQNEFDWLA
jgi:hypothetical protein